MLLDLINMKFYLIEKSLKKFSLKEKLTILTIFVKEQSYKFVIQLNKSNEVLKLLTFYFKSIRRIFLFTILTKNFKTASLNKYNFHFFLDFKTMTTTFFKFFKSKNMSLHTHKIDYNKVLNYKEKSNTLPLDIGGVNNALVLSDNQEVVQQRFFKKNVFFKSYIFFLKNIRKLLRVCDKKTKNSKNISTTKIELWNIKLTDTNYSFLSNKIINVTPNDYVLVCSSDSDSESSSDEDVILVKYEHRLKKTILNLVATKINFSSQVKTSFFFNSMLTSMYILNNDVRYSSLRSRRERTVNSFTTDRLLNDNFLKQFGGVPNSVPFFYLSSIKSDTFIKFAKREYQENVNIYLRQYLGGFIENLVNTKVYLKVRSRMEFDSKKKKKISTILLASWIWQKILGPSFFLTDSIHIMCISFFFKDLNFLMRWFTKSMNRLKLNKHKRFIKFFKKTLKRYEIFFLDLNKVKGFKFDIRGKVGVSGNAKKRHTSFYFGNTSFSTKKLRLDYSQGLVYTDTGVLGVTMILCY